MDLFLDHSCLKYISMTSLNLYQKSGSYLYAGETCIFHQDEDVYKIEDVLNREFSTLYEWIVDNKLSVHSGENKTKCILSSKTKR